MGRFVSVRSEKGFGVCAAKDPMVAQVRMKYLPDPNASVCLLGGSKRPRTGHGLRGDHKPMVNRFRGTLRIRVVGPLLNGRTLWLNKWGLITNW